MSPNYTPGRTQSIKVIVIHWWGEPSAGYTFDGVVNYFMKPSSQVSAHYVVSEGKIKNLVNPKDTAWHARQANPFSIGIEVDPKGSQKTYETVARLVADLRKTYGNLPLKKHSDYVATKCPGSISLRKIEQLTKEDEVPTLTTRTDLNRIYKDVLGRDRNTGEGEDVYLKKDYRFVHTDVRNSAEAKRYRAREAAQDAERLKLKKDNAALANEVAALERRVKQLEEQLGNTPPTDPDSVTITKDGLWTWFKNLFGGSK